MNKATKRSQSQPKLSRKKGRKLIINTLTQWSSQLNTRPNTASTTKKAVRKFSRKGGNLTTRNSSRKRVKFNYSKTTKPKRKTKIINVN